MNLQRLFHQLIQKLGPGYITPSAYDTAWVARLAEWDIPMGKQALDWLRHHQLADGSWGTPNIIYHHERLICTLSAVTALARQRNHQDRKRLRHGQHALELHANGLKADPAGSTVGFEMLTPALMSEAISLGAIHHNNTYLGHLLTQRQAKLASLPNGLINRHVTVAFSLEMLSPDEHRLLDLKNLREANGSVACSPAATIWYMLHIENDEAALKFIQSSTVDNESEIPCLVPYTAPIDIFEVAWALWNVALTDYARDPETIAFCQRPLDFLESNWQPGIGMTSVSPLSLVDGDTTSLTYHTLSQFGRSPCLDDVFVYEEENRFRCFRIESNPSFSTNVHVLGALRHAGLKAEHPTVSKVRDFLRANQVLDAYWFDKWHASPYYTTCHAVIACAGYDDALVETAVQWILDTQFDDGSWGYYSATAEETAYCLQALIFWQRSGKAVPQDALQRGRDWLANHMNNAFPPLWIGKCLYSPILAVDAAILSALALTASC